ncbi:MAG: hypothetical protein J5601_00650 [Elusimicrobiaceae bacterium]|nr:hypothetical protein [Elusimicrobiaceae bacterium]
METEEIIHKLRHPEVKTVQPNPSDRVDKTPVQTKAPKKASDWPLLLIGSFILLLLLISGLWVLWANNRSSNLSRSLDKEKIQGLQYDREFNPTRATTILNIQEGQDRIAAVPNLGSTLPIMSRFNYKSFTEKMYTIVGSAPWALTENFSANRSDPEMMRYLLGNDDVIKGFVERPDVAPLLEDPQMLAAFTEDQVAMQDFFDSETVRAVLADEQMVAVMAGSRFMARLLISPSIKYFRDNPQEALQIIKRNPYLNELRRNEAIRQAVKSNHYLKDIAATLLEETTSVSNPQAQG